MIVNLWWSFDPYLGGGQMANERVGWAGWPVLVHSARTAVAGLASLLVARVVRLPGAYWAPITSLVITQAYLSAALEVSLQRFEGTALRAGLCAIVASVLWSS